MCNAERIRYNRKRIRKVVQYASEWCDKAIYQHLRLMVVQNIEQIDHCDSKTAATLFPVTSSNSLHTYFRILFNIDPTTPERAAALPWERVKLQRLGPFLASSCNGVSANLNIFRLCVAKAHFHDTTGCQTGCTTGWMFVYTMQPVVQPAVQLNSRLHNRFEYPLDVCIHDTTCYPAGCQTGLTTDCIV